MEGWPTPIEEDSLPFTSKITELTVLDGCILWGNRVVIPKELQATVLQELYIQHSYNHGDGPHTHGKESILI